MRDPTPVSYMSHRNQAQECSKLFISNWLFVILVSPLSRPPGYSGGYSRSCPESSSGSRSAGCLERNLDCCTDGCSVSNLEGYPERNLADCPENRGERCSPTCSAVCPANRSGRSSLSSLPDSPEDGLHCCSENYPEDSPASSTESTQQSGNGLSPAPRLE